MPLLSLPTDYSAFTALGLSFPAIPRGAGWLGEGMALSLGGKPCPWPSQRPGRTVFLILQPPACLSGCSLPLGGHPGHWAYRILAPTLLGISLWPLGPMEPQRLLTHAQPNWCPDFGGVTQQVCVCV